MTGLPEYGRRALVASVFAAAVKTAEADAKTAALELARVAGIRSLTLDDITGPDGTVYGHIQIRKGAAGKTVATITDEAALLDFVRRNLPEHVDPEHTVVVPARVNPEWLRRVLAYAAKFGTTGCADTEGTELPGISIDTQPDGAPSVAVCATDAAKRRAAEVLAGVDLLALPTTTDGEVPA